LRPLTCWPKMVVDHCVRLVAPGRAHRIPSVLQSLVVACKGYGLNEARERSPDGAITPQYDQRLPAPACAPPIGHFDSDQVLPRYG
jgi:hypothetical protein